ncbi:hypothetical protein C8Q75DRAFT_9212 [Abortiporus biennis]|nr:hypothetical protein C8Q75DRAFT_9212 [Abortiporus biennis]
MHSPKFLSIISLLGIVVVANARPIDVTTVDPTGLPAIGSTSFASMTLSDFQPSAAPNVDSASDAAAASTSTTSTAAPSTASLVALGADTVSVSATHSISITTIQPSGSDDPSLAAIATASGSSTSITDSFTSATATDISSLVSTPATSTDDVSSTAIVFTIPTAIPSACIAKALGNPIITSTPITTATGVSSADPSTLTSIPDASSLNGTTSDSSANINGTSSLPSDSISISFVSIATATIQPSIISTALSPLPTDPANIPNPADNSTTMSVVLSKRIAQADLPDIAQSWQDLCLVSGGDIFTNEPCVTLAGINGINALLANADPCDQQDNADVMIDFAKSEGVTNSDALIANAIAYRKHPRNALDISEIVPSTPFCQKAPRNEELVGVVNDQLDGVNPGIFGGPTVGLFAFGDDSSTCPFGTTPDVDSCSCS